MGSWCSCCAAGDDEKDKKFEKGGDHDLSNGPVSKRGCTDICCVPLFIFAQVVFVVVTVMGMADGNPEKLYKPRDYRGNYCGVEENWNGGSNTVNAPTLSYTMNVTSTVDTLMKQMVCSSMAKTALVDGKASSGILPLLTTKAKRDKYMCDCCLSPCAKCDGSLDKGVDLKDSAKVLGMATKMSELTDLSAGANLFSPTGANGEMFSTNAFWEQATKYFNMVCLPDCNVNFATINASTEPSRSYTYTPAMDDELFSPWEALLNASDNSVTNSLVSVINSSFSFTALPKSICPYAPALCVPMPGMEFSEVTSGSGYCTFEMAAAVIDAVGDVASAAFASLGGSAIKAGASEEFGKWVGDFQKSIDTFIIVSVLSFVVGLVFLVVLRFTIGICVWIAVSLTVLLFFFGGSFLFVLSGQCQGSSVFETGQQVAVAVAVTASHAAKNAVSGKEAPSEAMDPALNGSDYRGAQRRTRTGKSCQEWDTQESMPGYNSTYYPNSGLTEGMCRNPYNLTTDAYNAKTIWCVTSDLNLPWEECIPIGVIQPECAHGYEIDGQSMRDALYYMSFVVWALGLIWIILIMCFVSRIRLAIALNKVAAVFLASNPTILLVPIVQGIVSVGWILIWFFGVSFLLSQVPADYTPQGYFATYAEAYGTSGSCAFWEFGDKCNGTPGVCTDKWPTGFVWKDSNCPTEDGVVKCYRCAPPRYMLDWRFAVSFFVFLWNNAFNVAMGQIMIAMAVSIWFFTKNSEKSKTPVVLRSVKTIIRYHVGSVAFGSFIVAVIQFIRYLMKYFEKQAQAQKNRVLVLILKAVQCCIWLFEKCVKFLNKNAYIQIALMGKGFCRSAKAAFFLILRNALRFGTIAALSGMIHAIGFMFIMVATCVIGYFLEREMHPDISPFMPVLCFFVVSYEVADLFMSVFGLAVDTSLQCFIACEEMGDVNDDFVPASLKNFVNEKKTKPSAVEDKPATEEEFVPGSNDLGCLRQGSTDLRQVHVLHALRAAAVTTTLGAGEA
eukprot:CAMPEP_0203874924 /NCGR_PEP_ID=MMETSP0359-20131031/20538_1 /ASSEMBLY_ACC=CAM_ASM_000338 /TAXON_ID=268821 /ORGANISM="Scrippsiella Hangoei, Strain SHTV-5" /LENGTH=1007 /DNA_ID=CAMNT_0050793713 /DNA_START=65 /DNA_END=3089 /DNA_ORIENTATION=-